MSGRALLPALLSLVAACRSGPVPMPPTMPEAPGSEDAEQLPLGSSPRRAELLTVRQGEIVRTLDGQRLTVPALLGELAAAGVVLVGEEHAHREHHAIEAQLLDGLGAQRPGAWALGLEMFPRSKQPWLDRWVAGELEERDFVRQVDWYQVWGFDWRYYRELLLVARARRIPVLGLNAEAALVRRVGRGGVQGLSPDERATLPALDFESGDHRRLFRALLGLPAAGGPPVVAHGHGGDPHQALFENMLQAQVLRDIFMAETARAFLEGAGRGKQLLVVAGSGHVLFGLGINGRLGARAPSLRQRTVICEAMPAERPAEGHRVSAGLGDVVWGTAPQGRAVQYPSLGTRLEEGSLRVAAVSPHGAASGKVKPGDELLALDGTLLGDVFDLRWALQQKDWGDRARLRVRRAGAELDLGLELRRY